MPDALGVTRKMQVEKWAWLIGLSDADDARLLEWSRSFATPPQIQAEGARLQSPSYNTERRATLFTVEKSVVSLTITPSTPCIHPVFEFQDAPKTLSRVERTRNRRHRLRLGRPHALAQRHAPRGHDTSAKTRRPSASLTFIPKSPSFEPMKPKLSVDCISSTWRNDKP
jgi:hypothetical protein